MNKIFRYAMVTVAAVCTLGFASCSDDDDDDKSSSVDQSAVVGTWQYNASESSTDESVTMAGQPVSLSDITGSDDEDDDEDASTSLLDEKFILTADGKVLATDSTSIGTYSISGSDLTLTEEGQTIKKGATIDLNGISVKVSTCSISVSGDKMTVKIVAEGSFDLSSLGGSDDDSEDDGFSLDLGGLSDLFSSEVTVKLTSVNVYDRQK